MRHAGVGPGRSWQKCHAIDVTVVDYRHCRLTRAEAFGLNIRALTRERLHLRLSPSRSDKLGLFLSGACRFRRSRST